MTQEEIIRIFEKMQDTFLKDTEFRNAIDSAIEILSQPSLPSNLDEAAEEFASNAWLYGGVWHEEWMAGRGISYDATISADKTIPVLPMKDVSNMGLDYGDNVTVQLWKK